MNRDKASATIERREHSEIVHNVNTLINTTLDIHYIILYYIVSSLAVAVTY